VNIALPSAQRDLGISDGDRQWVITAYTLAFGGLLLLGGRIADLFGRKKTFLIGLIGFAGASALGGAAQSFAMPLSARAAQGVAESASAAGAAARPATPDRPVRTGPAARRAGAATPRADAATTRSRCPCRGPHQAAAAAA
jgi:MFS family permease